jgi:hypothetical protein
VPNVLKILEFCWTVSLFLSPHRLLIFSRLKNVGLIHYITSFSHAESLCVLYTTLVQPKLKYACVAWNSIMKYLSKLERVQRKFAALHYNRLFFVGVCCNNYEGILARHNIPTLYCRRQHLDTQFLINVFKNN